MLAAAAVVIGAVQRRLPGTDSWRRRLPRCGGRRSRALPGGHAEVRVAPTELTRETPYLRHHIAATRQAWGSTASRSASWPPRPASPWPTSGPTPPPSRTSGSGTGSPAPDLRPAPGDPHLLRLRLGRRRPLLDRRELPAGPALAPRAERRVASDPHVHQRAPHVYPRHGPHPEPRQPGDRRRSAGPVHQGSAPGLHVSLQVTRPQIYYGELANEYVFVGTRQREFDHPSGEANVYATYPGRRCPGRQPLAPAAARHPLRLLQGPPLAGHREREPGALPPEHHRPGEKALPFLRSTATRT